MQLFKGVSMSTSLLVGNLPVEVSEEELLEHFSPYGKVKTVTLVRNDRGGAKGFAVVVMSSRQEAIAAAENLSSQELGGRRLTVSLRKISENSKGFLGFLKLFG
jgi:polyadenylate-binding protein